MADYFAVLNRTLSGFTDPKPQLREKLYERARATIERQLQMKSPAPDAATMQSEMQKLEEAIGNIERGYNPDYVDAEVGAAAEPVADVSPLTPIPEPEPEVLAEVQPAPEPVPVEEPAFVESEIETPVEQPMTQEMAPETLPESELIPEPLPPVSEPVPTYQEPVDPRLSEETTSGLEPVIDPAVEPVAAAATAEPDPLDAWADEFLSNDPSATAVEQQPNAVEEQHVPPAAPAHEIPNFDDYATEELVIPPATAHMASAKPKRKFGKWLLLLLILLLLGAAGSYGWMYKDGLIDRFGLSAYFDDPTRPKPVKTITITPEPEQPESEPQSETQDAPKSETRLTESGEEVTPDPTTTTPEVTLPPSVGETAEPAETIAPAVAGSSPVVAQSAILYEEGSSPDKNSIDSGRVVWSVVQESTGNGEETIPAIRGRVEIPDRSAVLIMTIKRNSDQALPASHLIELIFAVPDDFSGGTIENINRYVLKENEQGQGEALVGVPARIADGIFLIALNNLDDAKKKNTSLLRERDWIDIPMQYRTGRRALMTIEKGVPGEKVFKEVFDAWDKLDAS